MIDTTLYGQIRHFKHQGLSMRQTAKTLGISRHTVKRYWDGAHTPDEKKNYPPQVVSERKAAIMAALEKYYADNLPASLGKQQINAHTAWESIRETYTVGESTVRQYVRELRAKKPQGFIPLSFDPGECLQVDWCENKVSLNGTMHKVPVFCAVLPYSYGIFAQVMPNMQTPNFFEALIGAFTFFGGVPQRVFFDNLRTAVFSGSGKYAVKQERFKMLEAHYAFESVFMNIRSGNEKGAVENLCDLIRGVALTPIPKGKTLQDIQDQILRSCLKYNNEHKIRDRKTPIAAMLIAERSCLNPLPIKPFSAYAETQAVVGSDLTFRYNATKYSVPEAYIGKTITIRASCYQIEAWYRGEPIATHTRAFLKEDHQYQPEHYLDLLERKPRSHRNAVPLRYGNMPEELEKFRTNCRAKDKYEQLVKILLLGRSIDADILLKAVDYANKSGSPTYETVRFYLDLHHRCADAEVTDDIFVDKPQMQDYDALLGSGRTEDE